MKSLRNNLLAAFPRLPECLASPYCRQRMLEIADPIPTVAISKYGFEAWLGKEGGRSDFLYKIGPSLDQVRAWLNAASVKGSQAGSQSVASQLCADWLENRDGLQDIITDLWLEHDAEPGREGTRIPDGNFIGLKEDALQRNFAPVCDLLLPRLLPAGAPDGLKQCLKGLVESLPSAHIFHIGTLPQRAAHFLRVCVTEVKMESWAEYLGGQFPQRRHELRDALQTLQSLSNFIVVDLDLWEAISPRLGFECYIWDWSREHAQKWPVLFAALIKMGLMTSEQADALRQWPGYSLEESKELDERMVDVRRLHHVKMTWDGEFKRAKAYFGVEKLPRTH